MLEREEKKNIKKIIVVILVGILMNVVGRWMMFLFPEHPLYLNYMGLVLASYYGGPVSGLVVSAATVLFGTVYGFFLAPGRVAAEIWFLLPMFLTSFFIGHRSRNYRFFEKRYQVFGTYAFIAMIRSLCMIPINSILYDGRVGIPLCDAMIDYLEHVNAFLFLKYALPSMMVCFLDSFVTFLLLYIGVRIHKSICRKRRMKSHGILALALMLGLSIGMLPDCKVKADSTNGENFVQTLYNAKNGLLGGAANDIAQTADGAIWVGTYGGVYRFNGQEFTMLRDMPQARSAEHLYVDSQDNLWIASNGTGLTVRTPRNEVYSLTEDDGLPSDTVRAIAEEKNGLYYVGTAGETAIVAFDGEGLSLVGTISDLKFAWKLASTGTGEVIAKDNEGTLCLLREGKVVDRLVHEDILNDIWVENAREVYAAYEDGCLLTLSVAGGKIEVLEERQIQGVNSLEGILVSKDGVTYLTTAESVGYIGAKGQFITIQTGDFNNNISGIMEDYQGNIWFTSTRCGILELSPSAFTNVFDVCNVPSDVVNAVTLWDGLWYVGADRGLVVLNEKNSIAVENELTRYFDGYRIRSLFVDADNHLWVTTGTGIFEVVSETEIYPYSKENGLPNNKGRCVAQLPDGSVMASTNGGLAVIRGHEVTDTLLVDREMQAAYGLCILPEDDDSVLVGTNGDGICVLKNGKVDRYVTHKDGIPSGVILRIVKDQVGEGYFVLSGSGMCYMYPDYRIQEFSEFPYYNNTDLFQTSDGKVIVLSTAGIYVVDYKDLMSFGPMRSEHLDEKMGLPGSVTSNAWNYYAEDDTLYFAGNTGIYRLNCRDYGVKIDDYLPAIHSLFVDGVATAMSADNVIYLPAGTKKVSFELRVFNYTTTDPFVMYYLDTEGPVMVRESELKEITYFDLSSGAHKLTVEVWDVNQTERLSKTVFGVVKEAETYESLEFLLFFFVGIALIIGTIIGWLAIIMFDINARRQRERYAEALQVMEKEKAEALQKSLRREEAANRSKSDFLANMSHEIRTPINAIIGMDTMIMRESEQEEIKTYAHNILGASNTLLSLINDILDFSKIESGKMELVEADYSLGHVINDLVVMVKTKADAKGLELKVEANADTPAELFGDEGRIKQIILNILNNAVKYTERGRVTLRVDYEPVGEDSIALCVAVEDTGIGIKEEDISKLFSPFERIEENRNKNIEGTGLGMSITKNLLSLMNSQLEVSSVYGEGSCFSFAVVQPVHGEKRLGNWEAYAAEDDEAIEAREKFHAKNAKILVVDDVEMNLIVVQSLLKRIQIGMDLADSGAKAITLARETKYDIIFLDAMMPEMDGEQTLLNIKSGCPLNATTPIVMLTANAIKGAREEYLAKGFDNYLSKPVDGKKLEDMIQGYLPADKMELVEGDASLMEDAADAVAEAPSTADIMGMLSGISMIQLADGIDAAGGKDTYLNIVRNFYDTATMRIAMIQDLFDKQDIENYTIQVHALKSSARLVGAMDLSKRALELEMAGKEGNLELIQAETPGVIATYEALRAALETVFGGAESLAEEDTREVISEKKLKRNLSDMYELLEAFDVETAKELFTEMTDTYRMPDDFSDTAKRIRMELAEVNRDTVLDLLKTFI